MVSSAQQQTPQQSPVWLIYLRTSHTMKGVNIVNAVKYKVRIPIPQKKQKLFKAGSSEVQPNKKAKPFVKDVIVID